MTVDEREKLYNEVWAEPMTTVSKKYGISDVALRKRCIAAGIPVPPAGYWAKLRAGKEVQKIALPALTKESKKHVSGYAIQISKDVKALSDVELLSEEPLYIYSVKSKELIQTMRNSIIIPSQLRNPDRLIQEHKDEMNYREKQIKLNPGYKNSQYWFRNISTKSVIDISVSSEQIHRAYLIMDTLIKSIEQLEGHIKTENYSDRDYCTLKIPGGIWNMSLYEDKTTTGKRYNSITTYTGCLNIKFHSGWYCDAKELIFSDNEKSPLENQLGEIIYTLFDTASKDMLVHEQSSREWDRKRQQEELERKKEQRRKEELQKLDDIEKEAQCYKRAQLLREYAQALKSLSDISADSEVSLEQKIQWILEKADWLDPLVHKDDFILGVMQYAE